MALQFVLGGTQVRIRLHSGACQVALRCVLGCTQVRIRLDSGAYKVLHQCMVSVCFHT
jgi:hypothetical protein